MAEQMEAPEVTPRGGALERHQNSAEAAVTTHSVPDTGCDATSLSSAASHGDQLQEACHVEFCKISSTKVPIETWAKL